MKRNPDGSVSLRLLIIGALVLILLIPTGMITGLINERRHRKEEAVNEVTSKWARAQTIGGPLITIPYEKEWKDTEGRIQSSLEGNVHFLPQNLQMETVLQPQIRYRGIFKAVLYNAKVSINGYFSFADLENLGVASRLIHWREAIITLNIPDMRGIKESITLNWNGRPYSFTPGLWDGNSLFGSGVSAKAPLTMQPGAEDKHEFSFALDLNGSDEFNLLPLGRTTSVKMTSTWGNPSFIGAFLPEKRQITEGGFTADWKVLDLNRNYPQQWIGEIDKSDVFGAAFGVKLFAPVDEYTQTTRAVKYVIMFVGLTFLIFFMVEIFNRRRIHPVQYLLVGLALCLFYVLLLSLAEHLGFTLAYLVAAFSTIGLITLYVAGALGGKAAPLAAGGTLVVLYGFLYVLLQNQDYALLIGSIGLFAIMAAVMYLTRKVDWYNIDTKAQQPASDPTVTRAEATERPLPG